MNDKKNPFGEEHYNGETIDVEFTETTLEDVKEEKKTESANEPINEANEDVVENEVEENITQNQKIDEEVAEVTEEETPTVESSISEESVSDEVKEPVSTEWSEHVVDQTVEAPETGNSKTDNNEYNVNFSTEGPKVYEKHVGKKKKKNKGAILVASIAGIFVLCAVITGSVYTGYTLSRIMDRGQTGQVAVTDTKTENVDLSNRADTVNVVKSPLTAPEIVKKVAPSVVAINTKVQVSRGYLPSYGEAEGSGFFYGETADEYYIATNNHVIDNAQQISVTLKGQYFEEGESFPATVKGRDPITDLAILVVKKSDVSEKAANYIKVADIGSSDDLVVGEFALAIGNPLGLGETVTGGMISAINREVTTDTGAHTVIQTDAAINPGNSGGALVNGAGQIVGINTLKIGSNSVEGIGFAIPIDTAKPILDDIIKNGDVKRPFVGISGQDVTGDLSKLYGLPIGVFIVEVTPGSPADLAGIQQQDVVVGINDSFITNMNDLKEIIQNKKVGDKVQVNLIRQGKRFSVDLVLQGR